MALKKEREKEVIVMEEIPIDEYDNEDLIYELKLRLKCKQLDRDELKELAKIVTGVSNYEEDFQLPCESLDDQMKIEFLQKNWENFTSSQLEERMSQAAK